MALRSLFDDKTQKHYSFNVWIVLDKKALQCSTLLGGGTFGSPLPSFPDNYCGIMNTRLDKPAPKVYNAPSWLPTVSWRGGIKHALVSLGYAEYPHVPLLKKSRGCS